MFIELRNGITIDPCSFAAVVGPAQVAKDLINTNRDLQRYLFLYVSGNYSRILTDVSRTSTNFDVRRAFTAHQFFTILNEVSHTVVFIEHDPTLFDGAWDMIAPIAGALCQISRESTVILYSPVADRSFTLLTRNARHVICFLRKEDPARAGADSLLKKAVRKEAQMTLDVVLNK